jgi:hypothetical protein
MPLEDYITTVFCLIDDHLKELTKGKKIRSRGPRPSLTDSEVITMEVVGEFLGIDTDKGIWQYFRVHWYDLFPGLCSRTAFVRQAANIWYWKKRLQEKLAKNLGGYADTIHLIDGFPIPVCKFKRAYFSSIHKGSADYGYCASKNKTYYGYRGHLVVSFEGVITSCLYTPASVDERDVVLELAGGIMGLLIGDKGYIRPELSEGLSRRGIDLQTPFRANMKDNRHPSFVKKLTSVRRLVETVIGQLSERFNIETEIAERFN